MPNKIRYGLKNVHYALYDEETGKYAAPVPFPGAVAMTLSREGGDSTDFYADDGIYHTFVGTNGGYSADLEMARVTDDVRSTLLGEIVDEETGLQFEVADAQPPKFALICEMQGDKAPIRFTFFGCKATRPELSANTEGESKDVDTDTMPIRISGERITYKGEDRTLIQTHIERAADNIAKFAAVLKSVVIPGVPVKSYKVTVSEAENGTVSVDNDEAFAGDTVTVTVTPDDGYTVSGVTAGGDTVTEVNGSYKFIMPESDVTVTATFIVAA